LEQELNLHVVSGIPPVGELHDRKRDSGDQDLALGDLRHTGRQELRS
jgi:hypothetical protein